MTTRTQPVQAPSGLGYGQRKQLEDAQKQVPLPDRTPVSASTSPQGAPVARPDVFGPTERPDEPITAGAAAGAGPANLALLPPERYAHIQALYNMFPHEDLRRLWERASELDRDRRG